MRSEPSPLNGLNCRSTYADLHISTHTYLKIKEILMTKEIDIPLNEAFIAVEKYLELVRADAKVLKGLSTHPSDAVVIGVLVDPSHPVVLAAARTEKKQRDLTDTDLIADTEAETAATRAALARLRPLVEKAKTERVSAEEVVSILQAEPDARVACSQLLAMKAGSSTIRDEREILISPDTRPLPRKFPAAKAYVLGVKVTALDENPRSARLTLIDPTLPTALFLKEDVGVRTISTTVTDPDDFLLLNLCMAFKVPLVLELAIELDIGGSGRTYTASMIRVKDPKATFNSIRTASKMQNQDLFNQHS